MKALVYHGPGQRGWDSVADPTIIDPTDLVVRIDSSTICGTDLHILKGDVPETTPGTVLTIPRLMKLVANGRLDPTIFATHRFPLGDTMSAYDTVLRRDDRRAEGRALRQRGRPKVKRSSGRSRRGGFRMSTCLSLTPSARTSHV